MDEKILIIIICVSFVLCLIGFILWLFRKKINFTFLTKRPKKQKDKKVKKEKKKEDISLKDFNLVLVDKFMYRKELLFWKFVNSILPRSFVAIPKVAICSIVNPNGDKNLYNDIMDKSLDLVIFNEQEMKPVLMIDLYDNTYKDDRLDEEDPRLCEVVERLGIKIVHILFKLNFDKEEVKNIIFDKLNIIQPEDE